MADELGHRAEPIDVPGHTNTRPIGLTVSDVANPFYAQLIRGAQVTATAAGYELVLGHRSLTYAPGPEASWTDGLRFRHDPAAHAPP